MGAISRARNVAISAALALLAGTALWAHAAHAQAAPSDLHGAPPIAQVTAVTYCAASHEFRIVLGDGSRRTWTEFAVMLKVDGSDQGPGTGKAVWVPARGPGDRILVIFAGLDDLKRMTGSGC